MEFTELEKKFDADCDKAKELAVKIAKEFFMEKKTPFSIWYLTCNMLRDAAEEIADRHINNESEEEYIKNQLEVEGFLNFVRKKGKFK